MFRFRRNESIGVDIGSFAVKTVQVRKVRAGWTVTAAGIGKIAQRGEDNNDLKETNSLRAIIDSLYRSGNTTNLAICGVSGPEVIVRGFEFTSAAPDEIERSVLMEARHVCPFNTDDIVIDYRCTSHDGGKTRGYLVAATNRLMKSKIQLTKKAGLDCALMDTDGLALLNCFNELGNHEPGYGVAILNVGSSHTTLVIEGPNRWPIIRDLAYAGDAIVTKIAGEKRMSVDAVKAALFNSNEAVPELRDGFQKAGKRLIVDITKTLRYYQTLERSCDVEKVLVCGGFALANGFVEFLSRQLPMETVLWSPFEKMSYDVGRGHRGVRRKNILEKNGPAMAVAAGLAMRSI